MWVFDNALWTLTKAWNTIADSSKKWFDSLVNFLNLKKTWAMLVMSLLILTTTLWVLNWISSSMSSSVYEIKFYWTQEAQEKFQSSNIQDNYKTIQQLLNFWSTFTYTFLKSSWFSVTDEEWLYSLMKNNIKNYNNNNLNFDTTTNSSILWDIKKIQKKYSFYWSKFDKYLFQDETSTITLWWWTTNKYVVKDLFINKWWLLKISCLLPQLWWKRIISNDWECAWIWYYVALKEFLLENSDVDIAFPISDENWWQIYLKKFNENWWQTVLFSKFIEFLERKDITNLFYVWEYWKKNDFINWIKKTYFYQLVFDWIFTDTLWTEFIAWNTAWLVDRKFNTAKKEENKDNNQTQDQTQNQKVEEKKKIYEENWSYYIDWLNELELAQLNYTITRRITENLFTSFQAVLHRLLAIDNTLTKDQNWCLMKTKEWWNYVRYSSCDLIEEMKWSSKVKTFFENIQERTENFWTEVISSVNFKVPMFWIWFTEWLTWFWIVWIQKLNWQDFLALKKFYFQQDSAWDSSTEKLWYIIWIAIWCVFIVFYYAFYLSVLFIISILLWMLYIRLSEQFSKKEKMNIDISKLKDKDQQFDLIQQLSMENTLE